MTGVSAVSGPVPRGLRLTFVVLTVVAATLAAFAAVRGVWLLVVVGAFFALANLAVLWTTRTPSLPRE
jgi:hypothetical protein